MKISLSLLSLLILLITSFANSSQAQQRKKLYYAKVYSTNNAEFRGVLKSADEKGVYIERKAGDPEKFIPVSDIRIIKLRKKGSVGTGTAIGMAVGLAGGVGVAAATHSDNDKLTNTLGGLGAAFVTFLGGAVGGSIGGAYKEIFLINGRSENYLQKLKAIQSFSAISNQ